MSKSFSQLIKSKQLPRVVLKWLIIVFGLSVLVMNILLLKIGMDSIIFWNMFDRTGSDNTRTYQLARILLVVALMFANVVVVLGMVGARNKNFLMSAIYTSLLSLFLLFHTLGAFFSVTLTVTEAMKWHLFDNEFYVFWYLIIHAFITIVSIIHCVILWRDEKDKKLKQMLRQTSSI